ncbi:uncharacterized protein [Primulina huaijiensis]|uniref:uncharacterized protein n=1 Tax=Primulina huaijiensis TaxID=1492673 RepID=UPI003CC7061F
MGSLSHDRDPNKPTLSTESQQKKFSVAVEKVENRNNTSKISSLSSSTSFSSSSSSSSSPDSPLVYDPFGDNDLFTPSIVSSHIDTTVSENSKETSNIQSAPPNANTVSVTDAPPTQTMEHNPTTSSYRIPSHVFARNKSTAPTDWSVASNESLFSIQMGNMSFTNDHIFWKSGELRAGDQTSTSGQMFSYSAVQCAGSKAGADTRSRELGIAEATMKEVIRDSENQKNEKSLAQATEARCVSHRSEGSRTSTKSFAFCTMTGDHDKGASIGYAASLKRTSQEQSRPHSTITEEPETEPSNTTGNVATRPRWFPCVPSCWSWC